MGIIDRGFLIFLRWITKVWMQLDWW